MLEVPRLESSFGKKKDLRPTSSIEADGRGRHTNCLPGLSKSGFRFGLGLLIASLDRRVVWIFSLYFAMLFAFPSVLRKMLNMSIVDVQPKQR